MTKLCSMIDIETVGSDAASGILAIACVIFDIDDPERNFIDEFKVYLNIRDQLSNYGRTFDKDTMKWWQKQSKEVRDVQFAGTVSLEDGIKQFLAFINSYDCKYHWAKGTHFDFPILKSSAKYFQLEEDKFFKDFWLYMCSATTGRLYSDIHNDTWMINNMTKSYNAEFGKSHDPLVDCYIQIEILKDLMLR